jgi:hypothetical protein
MIAALRNTQGQLATALEADVPPFAVWALALAGVAGLGFIPGMRVPSRYILALVILVLVLRNYQAILAGFTGLAPAPAPAAAAATPAAAVASGQTPTAADVAGGGGTATASSAVAAASPLAMFQPGHVLTAFEEGASGAGFGGFA